MWPEEAFWAQCKVRKAEFHLGPSSRHQTWQTWGHGYDPAVLVSLASVFGIPGKRTQGDTRRGSGGLVAKLYLILCNLMDCSLPGSSVHGLFQARTLERVAISFSSGSSYLGLLHCRQILYHLKSQGSPSVQFSHSVVSDSLRPYESQHARPPCPSPAPP